MMIIAAAAMSLVSCNKDQVVEKTSFDVTLRAGSPETKTALVSGSPVWKVGDAIGVTDGAKTNYKYNSTITDDAAVSDFKGTTELAAGEYYAYSPYQANGVNEYGAKVEIAAEQFPTAGSFDGASDVLVSKVFEVSAATKEAIDLQFARISSVAKVVLKDAGNLLAGEKVKSLTVESDSLIVGRAYIDFENVCINAGQGIYSNGSKKVTATFTGDTQYAIDGKNAAYINVWPVKLAAGSSIKLTAVTDNYVIEKTATVPAGGLAFESGAVETLSFSIAAANITSKGKGASLPWSDTFDWQKKSSEDSISDIETLSEGKWVAASTAYAGKEIGAVRIGKSGGTGSITSQNLDLSAKFYVCISAKAYNTGDAAKLVVSAGSQEYTAAKALTGEYADYYFQFDAVSSSEAIRITTTTKRAIITAVSVVKGEAPGGGVTKVTGVTLSDATASIEVGGTKTLVATVAPANADNTNVTWSSDKESVATVSAAGVVTGVAEGTANITVTTEDGGFTATCKVTVVKPTGTGKNYVKVVSASGLTAGKYLIVVESQNVAFNGTVENNWGRCSAVTIASGKIASTTTIDGYAVTLTSNSGKWTIEFPDGSFMDWTAAKKFSNGATAKEYSISIDDSGNAAISYGTTATVKYNYNTGNGGLRSYASGQTAVQLYKLDN